VFSREIKEAVIGAANDIGEDGNGAGGMRGCMRHLAMNNEAVFGGLLRGVMGTQVTVERQREAPAKTEQEVRDGLARIGLRLEDLRQLQFHSPDALELSPDDYVNVTNTTDKDKT
jgi:alkylation response protein AidB-like acyl-CoA dehydrogenase